jgi:hypothetical protein
VDTTEITRAGWEPLGRVRRRFGRAHGPASTRALAALTISAFLLGGVLSALLFVGVWRHTAAEGDRARQAQVDTRLALREAQSTLAVSQRRLAESRAAARRLEVRATVTARELVRLRKVDATAASSLRTGLAAIAGDADELTHESAKLQSAVATLNDYIRNSTAGEIDPAFLAAQIRYLSGANGKAKAAAADLVAHISQAQASARTLRPGR